MYQIKPIWNNTKTIFKIMGAIKDHDKPNKENINKSNPTTTNINSTNSVVNDNSPNFFL